MDLSIIIPSYNTNELLDRCLQSIYASLASSKILYEIIVVDNASTDGSPELLRRKYPRVKKILNNENVGYGRANNQAIAKTQGEFVLLLNSDILTQDKSIEQLLRFGKSHPRGFIGGKLLNEDTSPQASCGPLYTLPVVFIMLFLKGDRLGISRYSPDKTSSVDWISGACILAKKQSFVDVGLFDEGIFLYMEEIDMFYRAKQKGYEVMFYPDAKFIHTGAASSGNKKTPVVNIYKGLIYFYRKHRTIMEQRLLIAFLTLKAYVAIAIAAALGKEDIRGTYVQALQVIS